MVLHVGVNPSSHCRCGGGGSFCLGYGVLPMVLHIGVNPSSHCRCVGFLQFLIRLWFFTYGAAYRSYTFLSL